MTMFKFFLHRFQLMLIKLRGKRKLRLIY
jgi:hypothetical protein